MARQGPRGYESQKNLLSQRRLPRIARIEGAAVSQKPRHGSRPAWRPASVRLPPHSPGISQARVSHDSYQPEAQQHFASAGNDWVAQTTCCLGPAGTRGVSKRIGCQTHVEFPHVASQHRQQVVGATQKSPCQRICRGFARGNPPPPGSDSCFDCVFLLAELYERHLQFRIR
jgi:hypothetical protein